MKCSDCGTQIKPVVALDIDGTIADYHRHLAEFAWAYWNETPAFPSFDRMVWDGSGNFEDYLGLTREQYRQTKLAFRQGGMKRTMPRYPSEYPNIAVNGWRAQGAEVWVTTTRPWQRHDNMDPDTRWWLQRMGIEFDGLLYDDDKYAELTKIVHPERVVAVLDDLKETCDRAVELGLPAIQVVRIHNSNSQEHSVSGRAFFGTACAMITDAIKEWRAEHG